MISCRSPAVVSPAQGSTRRARAVLARAAPAVRSIDVLNDKEGVSRAMATISQALMTDAVSLYLSTPASADAFHHAVMRSYLDSGPQLILEAAEFGCCALVGEVQREDAAQQQQEQQQQAAEDSGADGKAALLQHMQGGREAALARLVDQPHLERVVEEHGAALCVHFVGTHPERQGQGLGSVMLRHLCQLADGAGRHLYLEASTARSQALYARYGFVFVQDKPLGEPGEQGAPVMRVMVRPPAGEAESAAVAAAQAAAHV